MEFWVKQILFLCFEAIILFWLNFSQNCIYIKKYPEKNKFKI